jgi:DNA-binding CsgD family transcriptional regulator
VVGYKRLLKERLGASSTVDAIAIGIETGVIETDPGLDSIDSSRFDTLTPRQRVVYELLVEDYGHPTYDELAHRLGITEQGVKNAAVKIFRKLGLRDRKQAIELELKQRQGLSGEFDEAF